MQGGSVTIGWAINGQPFATEIKQAVRKCTCYANVQSPESLALADPQQICSSSNAIQLFFVRWRRLIGLRRLDRHTLLLTDCQGNVCNVQ